MEKDKKLKGSILTKDQINDDLIGICFSIYEKYFENVTRPTFKEHILKKDNVIILTDMDDKVQGFSTIKLLNETIEGKKVIGIFSGDTIIEKEYWGQQELVRTMAFFAGTVSSTLTKDETLFWLLISKGYKTYRYLPVFFHHFYPCFSASFPSFEQKGWEAFYKKLYPQEFNSTSGLIHFKDKIGNLKPGVGEITPERLSDPHVAFFAKKNPDHMKGVELACIAEFNSNNTKSITKDFFDQGRQQQCI